MIANNELLEWENVHGRLYGVPRHAVESTIQRGEHRVADIDVLGAMNVRRAFPNNTRLIFVQPGESDDVIGTVRERLKQRGEPEEEIKIRLQRVQMEMSYAPMCDYLVINEDLARATDTLRSIIYAEESRRQLETLRRRQNVPHHPIAYTTAVIITSDDTGLLLRGDIPRTHLLQGELPHEAISRATEGLITRPTQFMTPVKITLESQPYTEAFTFWYHVALESLPTLTDAWSKQDITQMAIPADSIHNLSPSKYV